MTYQDILVEFNEIRDSDSSFEDPRVQKRIMNLEWAMQSILEKLRDAEQVTKP